MKAGELKNLGEGELRQKLQELRDEAYTHSVKKRLGQLKNVHKIKLIKKDIARILTVLVQKKT